MFGGLYIPLRLILLIFLIEHNVHSRIDYFLTTRQHIDVFTSSDIGPKLLTDHAWLECTMTSPVQDQRNPSWSLNRSLLYSEVDCADLTKEIKIFFILTSTRLVRRLCFGMPSRPLWEAGSYRWLVGDTRRNSSRYRVLVKDIEFYESLHKRTGNPKALRKLEAARKALDVYEIPKIQKKKKNSVYEAKIHYQIIICP